MDKKERFSTRPSMILYFLKGCKRYFGLVALTGVAMVLFELVNPKIIGYTVDYIIGDTETIPAFILNWTEQLGGRDYVLAHLFIFSGVVILISLAGAAIRYLYRLLNSMGAEHLVKRMRDTLYEHITHLPFAWQDSNKTGDIIQRCTSDVDMIKNFISEQLVTIVRLAVLIVLSLYFMMQISWKLTITAAIFFPIVVMYSFFFHNKIGSSFEKVDSEEGALSAIAQENLTGVRVVRAFGREKYERDRFEEKNETYTGLWVVLMRLLSFFWVSNDLIAAIQAVTILSFGSLLAVRGEITAGQFVAFLSYNGLLMWPIRQLGRVVSEMSKAGISIDRIRYIMNSEAEKDAEDAGDFPGSGDIEFKNVTFTYPTEASTGVVLENLNFCIKKGQTVGILGATGSGKSTVIHLLDALYDLPEDCGTISVNGVDIRKIRKKDLRSHIGMVLQEPYLFSGTLEENIRLAKPDATHDDVVRAVETASLKHSIERFADGYETHVGERGVTLSGGQKQRTAIAQMLIREPEIMIFDDSLSAVDSETDARIRAALKSVSENATVLLISHRITTIMHADQILVLEGGKIIEHGNHDELTAKNGVYKRIFDLQLSQGDAAEEA